MGGRPLGNAGCRMLFALGFLWPLHSAAGVHGAPLVRRIHLLRFTTWELEGSTLQFLETESPSFCITRGLRALDPGHRSYSQGAAHRNPQAPAGLAPQGPGPCLTRGSNPGCWPQTLFFQVDWFRFRFCCIPRQRIAHSSPRSCGANLGSGVQVHRRGSEEWPRGV